jgi:ferritin
MVSAEEIKSEKLSLRITANFWCAQEYSELDEKMQKAFVDYLEERGIDAALGEYLLEAADSKEQKEYLQWLVGIQSFVRS